MAMSGGMIGYLKKKKAMKGAAMPKAQAMNVNTPMPAASPKPVSANSKPITSLDALRAKAKQVNGSSGMYSNMGMGY